MTDDAPGMRGKRSRDDDGQLRRKRGDTHVGTVEQQHGVDFGVRSDMHLDTLLKRRGAESFWMTSFIITTSSRQDDRGASCPRAPACALRIARLRHAV